MRYDNKQVSDIVNELSADFPCSKYDFDLRQCYIDILTYSQNMKKDPLKLKVRIDNGFLYIDGMKTNKVVYRVNNYNPYSSLPRENEIDYESLILARQDT